MFMQLALVGLILPQILLAAPVADIEPSDTFISPRETSDHVPTNEGLPRSLAATSNDGELSAMSLGDLASNRGAFPIVDHSSPLHGLSVSSETSPSKGSFVHTEQQLVKHVPQIHRLQRRADLIPGEAEIRSRLNQLKNELNTYYLRSIVEGPETSSDDVNVRLREYQSSIQRMLGGIEATIFSSQLSGGYFKFVKPEYQGSWPHLSDNLTNRLEHLQIWVANLQHLFQI